MCLRWGRALVDLGPQVTVWSQAVSVSQCCYRNKGPQTGGLKTTEIYCLRVMEAKNLKSRLKYENNRAMLVWDSWESPALFLPSFLWWPSVLGFPWRAAASLSVAFITWSSPLFKWTCEHIGLGTTPMTKFQADYIPKDFISK